MPPDAHRGVLASSSSRAASRSSTVSPSLPVSRSSGVPGGVGLGLLAILGASPTRRRRPAARRAVGRRRDVPHLPRPYCTAPSGARWSRPGAGRTAWSTKGEDVQQRTVRERADIAAEIDRAERTNCRRLRSAAACLLRRQSSVRRLLRPAPAPPLPGRRRRPAPPPSRPGLLLALLAALLGHGAVPTEHGCAPWSYRPPRRRPRLRLGHEPVPPPTRRTRRSRCAPGCLRRLPLPRGAAPRRPRRRRRRARRAAAVQAVLQNWAAIKNVALPFSDPLQIANATADNLHHLAIGLFALATFLWLLLSVSVQLLSRAGTTGRVLDTGPHTHSPIAHPAPPSTGVRTLMPPVLCGATLTLSALSLGCAFAYGPTACFASPLGCTGVKAQALSSLMLCLYALARLALGPAARASHGRPDLRPRPRRRPPVVGMCWVGRTRRAPSWAPLGTIRGLLPVGYWGGGARATSSRSSPRRRPAFACLSGGCCLLALPSSYGPLGMEALRSRHSSSAGASFPTAAPAGGRPTARAPRQRRRRPDSRAAPPPPSPTAAAWGGPDGEGARVGGKRWSAAPRGPARSEGRRAAGRQPSPATSCTTAALGRRRAPHLALRFATIRS